MVEILRDPIWQFVGALFAFIATLVSIYLFLLQSKKKSLRYDVLSFTPILTVGDALKEKIEILYEGNPVQNVHFAVVRFYNDGNIPIKESDYVLPLGIFFGEDSKILSAEIVDTTPKTLNPEFTIKPPLVAFAPLLLNAGDTFTFRALVARSTDKPFLVPFARIVGISDVKYRTLFKALFPYIPALLLFSVAFGLTLFIESSPKEPRWAGTLIFILVSLACITMLIPMLRRAWQRSKYEEKYVVVEPKEKGFL